MLERGQSRRRAHNEHRAQIYAAPILADDKIKTVPKRTGAMPGA